MSGIGTLTIGDASGDIESITFVGGDMIIEARMGHEAEGALKGFAHITGTDGTPIWDGVQWHDYGTKRGDVKSTWYISMKISAPLIRGAGEDADIER
jgi:hypothetical protein